MSDKHNCAEARAKQQKGKPHHPVIDARFSWRNVKQRPSSNKRTLTIIALLLSAVFVTFVVYALRFLSSLDFACTYDNRDKATCFFFFRQPLPPGCPPNCDGADLSVVNLRRANLAGADLAGANLRETNLRGAILEGADLRWADLREAKLSGAHLHGAWYNDTTKWPAKFDPLEEGAVFRY